MLKIRFLRRGKKKQPFYKIVVTDKRKPPKGGNFKEQVGFYNPLTKEKAVKKDRIEYWISKGAQLSDTVHNLLVKEGVIKKSKIDVHKKSKKKEEDKKGEPKTEIKEGENKEVKEGVKEKSEKTEGKPVEQDKPEKKPEQKKEEKKEEVKEWPK